MEVLTMFRKTLIAVFAAILTLGATTAHAAPSVRIVYVEWPCAVITTHIAKVVIEEKLGLKCEIIPVSAAVKYQSLATGEADATVCAWLPNTQKTYWAKVKNKVEDLGAIVGGAKLGWVVPDYVPYTSIEELQDKAKEFGGKIYGIDPGAEYMSTTEKAITGYGLKGFTLMEGSDATMVAVLADAIRRKEPVIVTGWAPHWKFGRWQLHFLDDPKGYFGEAEEIHAVVRQGLERDMPTVYAFLSEFTYVDTQQLQTLMAETDGKNDAAIDAIARKFVDKHPEQVAGWLARVPKAE